MRNSAIMQRTYQLQSDGYLRFRTIDPAIYADRCLLPVRSVQIFLDKQLIVAECLTNIRRSGPILLDELGAGSFLRPNRQEIETGELLVLLSLAPVWKARFVNAGISSAC